MSNCKQHYYQTLAFEMKVVLPSLSHCCKDPRYYSSLFSPLALLFQAKHPLQKKKKNTASNLGVVKN
jgi:hypothetical protein